MSKPKADTVSVTIRFPRDLHEKLVDSAYGSSPPNSFNREIVERLYAGFRTPKPDRYDALLRRVAELEAQVSANKGKR